MEEDRNGRIIQGGDRHPRRGSRLLDMHNGALRDVDRFLAFSFGSRDLTIQGRRFLGSGIAFIDVMIE